MTSGPNATLTLFSEMISVTVPRACNPTWLLSKSVISQFQSHRPAPNKRKEVGYGTTSGNAATSMIPQDVSTPTALARIDDVLRIDDVSLHKPQPSFRGRPQAGARNPCSREVS